MLHLLAADAVLILHLLFILLVAFGALAVIRWPRFALIQAPAAVWGFLVEALGWYCPLTDLENHLLRRAGELGYEGGFLERFLVGAIYPENLTREAQVVLAGLVLVVNAGLYGWALRRWLRNRRREG
jgi:hypothetical protein